LKELILEMEQYASAHNVPIIEKESITFIMKYIKTHNIKKATIKSLLVMIFNISNLLSFIPYPH